MKLYYLEKIKPFMKKPHFGFLIVGVLLVILRLLVNVLPPDIYGAIVTTAYYYLAGLGFALLLGYGGLASLGTGAFVGIGAFTLHFVFRYLAMPLTLAIIAGIILAILVSIAFGFVSLRISGMYLAIVTMGLSQIVIEVIRNIPQYASGTTGGFLSGPMARPLEFLGMRLNSNSAVLFTAVFVVIGMMIVHNLIHSSTGRALLSIKNSDTAAQTMGINLLKYRLFAFVISGVYGTLAGILSMLFVRNGNVSQIGITFALNILAAVVIGGTKSVWGIMLGTFVIFGLDLAVFQRFNLGNYSLIINGALIILVVMFYPGGLIQLFGDVKRFMIKQISKVKAHIYGTE
ncbi:MAG: branched-chain amino acid ABC transporter permease [Acholeplasmataceae bacterium]|jgi:branched-chain amino acid transport system permease protein|nr:branched-chain amino acid ABC transporter permease [Acholeplasmataceae bacterium]MDD4194695.1 branched-chain amino acid ABC transporter permease [Acholeplasmataceae bacterium]